MDPPALEAADPNLVGGTRPARSVSTRSPVPPWAVLVALWGTPVKGLYVGDAGVPRGGGVHGACGDLAARQAIADRRRPLLLAARQAIAGLAALGSPAAAESATVSSARRRRGRHLTSRA
jgi:hypothetical protein